MKKPTSNTTKRTEPKLKRRGGIIVVSFIFLPFPSETCAHLLDWSQNSIPQYTISPVPALYYSLYRPPPTTTTSPSRVSHVTSPQPRQFSLFYSLLSASRPKTKQSPPLILPPPTRSLRLSLSLYQNDVAELTAITASTAIDTLWTSAPFFLLQNPKPKPPHNPPHPRRHGRRLNLALLPPPPPQRPLSPPPHPVLSRVSTSRVASNLDSPSQPRQRSLPPSLHLLHHHPPVFLYRLRRLRRLLVEVRAEWRASTPPSLLPRLPRHVHRHVASIAPDVSSVPLPDRRLRRRAHGARLQCRRCDDEQRKLPSGDRKRKSPQPNDVGWELHSGRC